MLLKVGENLTSHNVEELASLAEFSAREKDDIRLHSGNKSLYLFQRLEEKDKLHQNNVLWLHSNLVKLQNKKAAKIVSNYVEGTVETMDFPNEPESSSSNDSDECGSFQEFLVKLGLQSQFPGKLTLKSLLKVKDVPNTDDYMEIFWQKLTSLDYRAGFPEHSLSNRYSMRDFIFSVLHCSDDFVRQDILEKMSACQLAVPIVLKGVDGVSTTFLLWALRRITKKWKGSLESLAIEQPIVSYPVFTVSVLRIGEVRVSKSQVLNVMLSSSQGYASHSYFLTHEKDIVKPKFSQGTIECAWFQPMHGNDKEIFKEMIAFLNLRGDCRNYQAQRKFACESSNLTIAFIETEKRKENVEVIREIKANCKNFLFIAVKKDKSGKHKSQKVYYPTYTDNWLFVKVIQMDVLSRRICHIVSEVCCSEDQRNYICLKALPKRVNETIQDDESKQVCKKAYELVLNLLEVTKTNDILKFKESCFPVQHVWKDFVNIDKDVVNENHESFEHQQEHILSEKKAKRELQLKICLSEAMKKYYEIITVSKDSSSFLHYIFGFLQDQIYQLVSVNTNLDLDKILQLERAIREQQLAPKATKFGRASNAVSEGELRADQTLQNMKAECSKLHRKCRAKTLGCEHFLRELGQLYEAFKELKHPQNPNNLDSSDITLLPELAANLVNEMHSLEILDGDTGSVPLTWVTSVLDTLTRKLGDPKVLVLSVIGVQSSGKSTFLNSMFGLRFPVRAGRCTRGLFIRFLDIEQTLAQKLGCKYLIVVDTEGIRSLEHEDRRFDNELVTLALSIANVTIFNIEGENVGPDMTGILQIAAHALMRMKEVDLECHCRIVQQRVSDLTAGVRNKVNTEKIMESLDHATKIAAEEEGLEGRYQLFADVVDLRVDANLQYIPCLWTGGMSPPNHLYSETVSKIKAQLFKDIREGHIVSHFTLSTFTQRVVDVWKAVKEEDFVFRFQDSVKAVDFNKFCLEYNKWIAKMRTFMVTCTNDLLYQIDHKLREETNEELDFEKLKQTLCSKVDSQRQTLTRSVQNFIATHVRRNTMQRYEKVFLHEVSIALKDIENHALSVLTDEYELQKLKSTKNLTNFKAKWRQRFSVEAKKVASLMSVEERAHGNHRSVFETHWNNWKDMVDKECEGRKLQMTFTSLQTLCEKLLVRITRDMAVGSEIKTLMSLEGGIDKHKELPSDCSKYIHTKFVKSWIRLKLLSKGKSSSDINAKTEEQLIRDERKEAVDYIQRVIKEKFDNMKDKQSKKPFDVNIYQLMIQSTLNQLSGKHGNLKPPHSIIAKSLLCISGKSLEWLYQNEALHGNNYSALVEEEKEMAFTDFVAFCNGHSLASRAAKFVYYMMEPLLLRQFDEQLRGPKNRVHTFSKNICEMPWDALYVIAKNSPDSVCNIFESLFFEPLQSSYLRAKREEIDRMNAMTHKHQVKANSFVSELIKKLERYEKESISLTEWGRKLLNDVGFTHSPLLGELYDIKDIAIVSAQLKNVFTTDLIRKLMSKLSSLSDSGYLEHDYFRNSDSFHCSKVCPMCKAPCDNQLQDHTEHFSHLHRPRGFKGATYATTQKLVIEDCSASILSRTSEFRYQHREYLCHRYKDVIPDWTIRPSSDDPGKVFWQWLFVMSNHYVAALYNCNPADIPKSWYDITKEEALESLQKDKRLKTSGRFHLLLPPSVTMESSGSSLLEESWVNTPNRSFTSLVRECEANPEYLEDRAPWVISPFHPFEHVNI
ncbi:Interferon-induced very large GTPase 1 [Holothuria leucospilota]|uniref:Interferon-induced very large GTPase 1 n=1 Tax=Holothuria leucospilota TaxID=206669 RepID=A0A9Q1BU79_HOLLE|nr:Interferon-induced very large GTPase 1 [Holothuria leucospilota]